MYIYHTNSLCALEQTIRIDETLRSTINMVLCKSTKARLKDIPKLLFFLGMYAKQKKKQSTNVSVAEISIFLSADTITVFKENFKYITVYNISSS